MFIGVWAWGMQQDPRSSFSFLPSFTLFVALGMYVWYDGDLSPETMFPGGIRGSWTKAASYTIFSNWAGARQRRTCFYAVLSKEPSLLRLGFLSLSASSAYLSFYRPGCAFWGEGTRYLRPMASSRTFRTKCSRPTCLFRRCNLNLLSFRLLFNFNT